MVRFHSVAVVVLALLLPFVALGQNTSEVPLSKLENAYNPIPSPDGKVIAYVRTGWGRPGGSGGTGRSNLRSEVAVMSASGTVLSRSAVAFQFLQGWTPDGRGLVCNRDGRFEMVKPGGGVRRRGQTHDLANFDEFNTTSEAVAYLSRPDAFVWADQVKPQPHLVIQTRDGKKKEFSPTVKSSEKNYSAFDLLVIPSPDERYVAVTENGWDLWVYDSLKNSWANLGKVEIHPDEDWNYIRPSWNPWFPDSSKLAFFSGSSLIVASPDGQDRRELLRLDTKAGLATPSPDGKYIAYATFTPRPMQYRPDLNFWGGSRLWVVSAEGKSGPRPVTATSDDTTFDIRWLGSDNLVFDRIADDALMGHSRLWKARVQPSK